jgi:carbonic anhydrase/acetyltransferase-like protein (isoleucine patch superfamily)
MLRTVSGHSPDVHTTAWIADNAVVAGQVVLGEDVSVWYSAVLRADLDKITVGARTNLQDGCVLHADPGLPLSIGNRVTVGHRAVLHGCRIEDEVLIGMGAIVMNGATVGSHSIVAGGALITEGTQVPPGSLVLGAPGKVRRETTVDERALIGISVDEYVKLAALHRAG